jgi:hypothetical protein
LPVLLTLLSRTSLRCAGAEALSDSGDIPGVVEDPNVERGSTLIIEFKEPAAAARR